MKSFLKEIEDKFIELENDNFDDQNIDDTDSTEDELDEMSTTGGVAGFNTPAAFAAPGKWKNKKIGYATGIHESIKPVSKKYKPEHYQTIEFDEEVQNDKFSFSIDDDLWWNKDMEYPSKDISNTPGTSHKKDRDQKNKSNVSEVLDDKYEQLIESYRKFAAADAKITPEQKVKRTIQEVAKRLREIEQLVEYNTKLKKESNIASNVYGSKTQKALTEISKRLIKISERVRTLGE